jgi:hypothetical protein
VSESWGACLKTRVVYTFKDNSWAFVVVNACSDKIRAPFASMFSFQSYKIASPRVPRSSVKKARTRVICSWKKGDMLYVLALTFVTVLIFQQR